MPQLQLPIFLEGVTEVTANVAYEKQYGQVVYYVGMVPIFMHDEDDMASFKMITSQLYINRAAKQVEIVNAFAINPLSLKRWVKKYREEEPSAFYLRKPRGRKTSKSFALFHAAARVLRSPAHFHYVGVYGDVPD